MSTVVTITTWLLMTYSTAYRPVVVVDRFISLATCEESRKNMQKAELSAVCVEMKK